MRTGASALSKASSIVISLLERGLKALSYILLKVGHMQNRVIKRAIPLRTAVGGTCCRESALFIKSSTMENLKKQVTRIRRLGASVKRERRSKSCTLKATSFPVRGAVALKVTFGKSRPVIFSLMLVLPLVEPSGKEELSDEDWAVAAIAQNITSKEAKRSLFMFFLVNK